MRMMTAVLLLAAAPVLSAARAQQNSAPTMAPALAAPKSGFRAEFLRDLDEVQKKILSLADAVPAEKYAWRPAPGVRSVSEVEH